MEAEPIGMALGYYTMQIRLRARFYRLGERDGYSDFDMKLDDAVADEIDHLREENDYLLDLLDEAKDCINIHALGSDDLLVRILVALNMRRNAKERPPA